MVVKLQVHLFTKHIQNGLSPLSVVAIYQVQKCGINKFSEINDIFQVFGQKRTRTS